MGTDLLDLTRAELEARLAEAGMGPLQARRVWKHLYRGLSTEPARVKDGGAALRRWLESNARVGRPEAAATLRSADGHTVKTLLALEDGRRVETVQMRFSGRHTACVSTQAGCAQACVFCATGRQGLERNLRAGEIVAQVLHVQRELGKDGGALRNLVFMGMGEPLHNYDAVMKAVEILCDPQGLAFAGRRITLSTVGLVPGILRLARERRPPHLAVSLHGSTDEERGALVPAGRRWPLAELMAACRTYAESLGRKIFFEWTLIEGVNDTPGHAARLAGLIGRIPAHVNVIPLNPVEGYDGLPSRPEGVRRFQDRLIAAGIPCTVRQRRGLDIAAGCGQLRDGVRKAAGIV
jgi:23S rRNA (adenine2503-C2)-methyltransferase